MLVLGAVWRFVGLTRGDEGITMQAQKTLSAGARPNPAPWRVWLRTARPMTLSATVSPLLVGTALAGYEGTFHVLPFVAALLSGLLLQIGANYFNEYFDYAYGLDHAGSLGASTVIFREEMTARQVLLGGVISFALAALLGVFLIVVVGPAILLFGLAAMAIAYFYSARPFKLASRGFGDPLVYLAMGLLMTWGAYFVQMQRWSWHAFAASVPVGLLVVSILNMNNVRDYEDDLAVAKRTVVVRFGRAFGQRYHAALLYGAYVATLIFALVGLLPPLTIGVVVTLPLAYGIVRDTLHAGERRAFVGVMKHTSQLHLYFGVVLAACLLFATVVHMAR
jgi:1,4-dihydroxy-2-naphthoate polyprenyltransferase